MVRSSAPCFLGFDRVIRLSEATKLGGRVREGVPSTPRSRIATVSVVGGRVGLDLDDIDG